MVRKSCTRGGRNRGEHDKNGRCDLLSRNAIIGLNGGSCEFRTLNIEVHPQSYLKALVESFFALFFFFLSHTMDFDFLRSHHSS